jgi:hypothetical protein
MALQRRDDGLVATAQIGLGQRDAASTLRVTVVDAQIKEEQ